MPTTTPIELEDAVSAGLARRLAALGYDLLLLGALLIFASALVVIPLGLLGIDPPGGHPLFRLYLLGVIATFYVGFWSRGGQTLGMRAWRLMLLRSDGLPLTPADALKRLVAAPLAWLPAGLGYLWILLDPQRRAWHDRLSGTRMVLLAKRPRGQ